MRAHFAAGALVLLMGCLESPDTEILVDHLLLDCGYVPPIPSCATYPNEMSSQPFRHAYDLSIQRLVQGPGEYWCSMGVHCVGDTFAEFEQLKACFHRRPELTTEALSSCRKGCETELRGCGRKDGHSSTSPCSTFTVDVCFMQFDSCRSWCDDSLGMDPQVASSE